MLDRKVLDDAVRTDLVLVGDGVAPRFVQTRRLKTRVSWQGCQCSLDPGLPKPPPVLALGNEAPPCRSRRL
jgi:hypothetical protein